MLFAQTVSGKPTIPPPSSSTKPPSVNMEELAKNTAYPKEAKEQNLEGMVNITVLIGTDSTAKEVRIESSTNPICNDAAIAAAKKTRWMPLIENDKPAKAWLSVPLKFSLGASKK